MKFGEQATFHVERVDKKGRGCGTIGTRQACVPFAGVGEEVEATLVKRRQGKLVMRLEKVLKPSEHRIKPKCAHSGICGGCAWQQFDYEHQLELKRGLLNKSLEEAGIEPVESVVPCQSIYYFRNRMDYCVGWKGEIGLKEPGRWNAYVDVQECHILSPQAPDVLQVVREWMQENDVQPWDAKFQRGYMRYVVVREGKHTGKRLVTIVTHEGELPAAEALVEKLKPLATTIYHGVNPSQTDLSISETLTLLHGEPMLEEEVSGKTFEIHPNSFFQTNTEMAEKLVETVRGFLADKPPNSLLDLYCGSGLFGICLSSSAERVVGVEIDPQAIESARKNAEKNGVTNAEYFAAKSEDLVWQNERPEVVIVDPPRAGLHPKVIDTLISNAPERIVYVSCNYESFAREWAVLGEHYKIEKMEALDLFPHSPHVELAALLVKKT